MSRPADKVSLLRDLIREMQVPETSVIKHKGPLLQVDRSSNWFMSSDEREDNLTAAERARSHSLQLLESEFREILPTMMEAVTELNVAQKSGTEVRTLPTREIVGRLLVIESDDEDADPSRSVSVWKAKLSVGKTLVAAGSYDEPDSGGDPTIDLTVTVSYSGRSSEWQRVVEEAEPIQIWTTGDLPLLGVSAQEIDDAVVIASRATLNDIETLVISIMETPRA